LRGRDRAGWITNVSSWSTNVVHPLPRHPSMPPLTCVDII
jgi:hypothetical protein